MARSPQRYVPAQAAPRIGSWLVVLLLSACALPSRTQPWCGPSGRFNHETHEVRAGVKCAW
jgi:hypothetical protein